MGNLKNTYHTVLTIAGSDSGGCAGIQADIKSISACGAFAASVITATTAQNTQGVFDIHPIPIDHIEKQLDAVFTDITFQAVKIGMLHSCEVIKLISKKLQEYHAVNVVIDPVMVATSGDRLITNEALQSLKSLLPQAYLITPNSKEAELLLEQEINPKNAQEAAQQLAEKYQTSVLLKGGHMDHAPDEMVDILYNFETAQTILLKNPKVETRHTHGTGCSLSSSIATFLSKGYSLEKSVDLACQYINSAILNGKDKVLGKGNGPINHFGL
ncbi:bifunctional hydroxymethylpyrimidine kinase/phosphomethylpyrimidine kinase [Nonlabens tegetincola]|uniref:bifunctional hydroxymethylpyrimidine kinase/phosphomethylpyrimidine kinase n=1 Tax=Nonlabens tegetincola TaxID=323273 RepID=UPI000A208CD7|nr:bifunctional hydroxymethylpyrimidine kinase/phosphomethylpyrimidine kinase [Nonlabens tegetincola]ARN71496.1 bifunctional hydroxymethylpyrimidine kinase/phosphomethylpyrimidine kinase [Nonlabens tegetincola]